MSTLIIIPARAGSKGLPGKNTRKLRGKPLVSYTIEFALNIKKINDKICVTTDDSKVKKIIKKFSDINLIERPAALASDFAGMTEVIKHVVDYCELENEKFNFILLLQPTSPIRIAEDYFKLIKLLDKQTDMVVSVKESKSNPYFNLFEENFDGFLIKSKEEIFKRRQDCPSIYEYNGSMYFMRFESFKNFNLSDMPRVKKYIMPKERSIDIDDNIDWFIASKYLK